MPGRPHHTQKVRDCVDEVTAKGDTDESSAYAICIANQQKAGNPIFEDAEGQPITDAETVLRYLEVRHDPKVITELATLLPEDDALLAVIGSNHQRNSEGKKARHLHLRAAAAGEIRTASFHGEEYVVVPVIALCEGVIFPINAETPELALASEYSRVPQGWNGRPIFFGHPVAGGTQVSGNTPEMLEAGSWGHVFNTKIDNGRLLMEAWLSPRRATLVGAEGVLNRMKSGEPVEVSVGVFVTVEDRKGTFGGRKFTGVWHDIVPDHLAILPDGHTGACSIEMGCGAMRTNADRPPVHVVTAKGFELITADASDPDNDNDVDATETADQQAEEDALKPVPGGFPYAVRPYGKGLRARSLPKTAHKSRAQAIAEAKKRSNDTGVPHQVIYRETNTPLLHVRPASAGVKMITAVGNGNNQYTQDGAGAHEAAAKAHRDAAAAYRQVKSGGDTEVYFDGKRVTTALAHAQKLGAQAILKSKNIGGDHAAVAESAGESKWNPRDAANEHIYVAKMHETSAKKLRATSRNSEGEPMHVSETQIEEYLRAARDIPPAERDKMSADDFAGKGTSYPIRKPADVSAAASSIGRAGSDNYDTDTLKANIIKIAYRKGPTFVAQLPDDWKKKADQKAAQGRTLRERLRDMVLSALRSNAMGGANDAEEQGELLSYQTMKTLLQQCGDSYDQAMTLVDDMIAAEQSDSPADNAYDEAAEEEVEGAQLDAIISLCMQMMGTLSGVTSIARSQNTDDAPANSVMGYLEQHRAAAGKRHSTSDQQMVQVIHDTAAQLGADCPAGAGGEMTKEQARAAEQDVLDATESLRTAAAGKFQVIAGGKTVSEHETAADAKAAAQDHANKNKKPVTVVSKTSGDAPPKPVSRHYPRAAEGGCGCGGRVATAEHTSTQEGDHMDRKERVKALLTNPKNPLRDEAALNAASDEALTSLEAHCKTAVEADDRVKTLETTVNELKTASAAPLNEEQFLARAPESIKSIVSRHNATQAARRADLVGKLKTATAGVYTEEQLKAMSLDQLETTAKLLKVEVLQPVDFSGLGLPRVAEDHKASAPPAEDLSEKIRTARGHAKVSV